MLKFELGVQDVQKDAGIKCINMPTHAQAASVPTGVDATCTIFPAYLAAQANGTVAIMNSFGTTEDHYEGPAGKGAGILLPSVKKSQFYPDGYYLHRPFWITRNALAEQHPNVVVAFLVAQQESVAALTAMDAGAVSQLVKEYWKLDAEQGAKVVKDDVLFSRGWSWPTKLAIGVKAGLRLELMMEVMKTTMAFNNQLSVAMPKKAFKGDDSPGFMVKLAGKDVRLAVELAKAYGFDALVGRAAQESLDRAGKLGYAERDTAALMKIREDELGIQVRLPLA